MALMITPGQFARRAEFYHQLAQLSGAGLGLIGALEHLQRHPPGKQYRLPIQQLLEQLNHGHTLSESLQHAGPWLPEFDLALLQAGEQSGRLEACLRLLSDYYRDHARLTRQMLGDLLYPAFLFHAAVFILPFSQLFLTGNWLAYLERTFGILVPVYALIALLIYCTQSRHGERWRAWVERIVHPIPVLGTARRNLALARLAAALEALLSAGISIVEAWDLAAQGSGSPQLRRVVTAWRPRIDAGQTPAEVLNASGSFPELFASQYTTGEVSGKLEETLKRLRSYYEDEGSRKLHLVAQWVPRGVYLLVVLAIAYVVVQFWSGYFRQIGQAGGF